MRQPSSTLVIAFVLAGNLPAGAAPVSPADVEYFEKQIRPVLAEHCWSCHGDKKQTAGLRLDSRAALLKATPRGVRLLADGRARRVALLASELRTLSAEDRRTLEQAAAILERLFNPRC